MSERTHTTDQAKDDAARAHRASGRAMTAADVQAVQRRAGNRAAQRLIAQRAVQAKLTVGPVDDAYEREADRMAEAVVSSPAPTGVQREGAPEEDELQMKPLAGRITPLAQREAMAEDEELQAKRVQREAMPEEDELQTERIQRDAIPNEDRLQAKPTAQRATDGSFEAGADIEQRIARSKGGGSALPDATRAEMEDKFGADFSSVRVHTEGEAAGLNRDLSAQAFTHGSDVYFGEGKFAPSGSEGKRLLAHELTHVVQQLGNKKLAKAPNLPGSQDSISKIKVDLNTPQAVTLTLNSGKTLPSFECSTGKGEGYPNSCLPPKDQTKDGNCTPVGSFTVAKKTPVTGKGLKHFVLFVPEREIGLHAYPQVTGKPLSHGCVRLHDADAKTVFLGSREGETNVEVSGQAIPELKKSQSDVQLETDKVSAQGQLHKIFAKGPSATPSEISQAKTLILAMSGEQFCSAFRDAISSGIFLLRYREYLEILSEATSEVVVNTTILMPAKDSIKDDFARANQVFNPRGIEIEQGRHEVVPLALTKKLLGNKDFFQESAQPLLSDDEKRIIGQNRVFGQLTAYWVPSTVSARGEALVNWFYKDLHPDVASIVIDSSGRVQDTFAHELGHALGEKHELKDPKNLMAPGGDFRQVSGNDIDRLTEGQLERLRKSFFVRQGRKGLGN